MYRVVILAMVILAQACVPLERASHPVRLALQEAGLLKSTALVRQHQRVLPPDASLYISGGAARLPAEWPVIHPAASIGRAFERHFTDVHVSRHNESRREAVLQAVTNRADYLVYPAVIPPALCQTGKAKVVVRLSLIDVQADVVVDSSTVEISTTRFNAEGADLRMQFENSMMRYAATFRMISVDAGRFVDR